jgi:hypothetical protein
MEPTAMRTEIYIIGYKINKGTSKGRRNEKEK